MEQKKKRSYIRFECASDSQILKSLILSKHNSKLLENGDVRIGDDMALNSKTNLIYKL
jgi:hypothetical protein